MMTFVNFSREREIAKDVGFLGGAVGGIEDRDAIARHAKAFHHVHLHVDDAQVLDAAVHELDFAPIGNLAKHEQPRRPAVLVQVHGFELAARTSSRRGS